MGTSLAERHYKFLCHVSLLGSSKTLIHSFYTQDLNTRCIIETRGVASSKRFCKLNRPDSTQAQTTVVPTRRLGMEFRTSFPLACESYHGSLCKCQTFLLVWP